MSEGVWGARLDGSWFAAREMKSSLGKSVFQVAGRVLAAEMSSAGDSQR